MSELYLVHHGILGQKWGVRRFQNKDGSLTEAGKKKYSETRNGSFKTDRAAENIGVIDKKYASASDEKWRKKVNKEFKKYEKLSYKDEEKAYKDGDLKQAASIAAGRTYMRTIVDNNYRLSAITAANKIAEGKTFVKTITRNDELGGIDAVYENGQRFNFTDSKHLYSEELKNKR